MLKNVYVTKTKSLAESDKHTSYPIIVHDLATNPSDRTDPDGDSADTEATGRRKYLSRASSYASRSRSSAQSSATAGPPPPPVAVCKQAVEADGKDAIHLETHATRPVFGDVNVMDCIEKRVCKSLFNTEGQLVAFMVVSSQPNVPALQSTWTGWARQFYSLQTVSPWNTLFIHYLVWDEQYPKFFIHFLKSVYKSNLELKHFILLVPPGQHIFKEISSHFTAVYARIEGEPRVADCRTQTVYLNLQLSVVKRLVVRRAGEEDNIDVQPILKYQYDILCSVFGGFRVGKVIDLQDKNKSILVAEKNGMTVGVVSLTSAVDYHRIGEFFYVPMGDFARSGCEQGVCRTDHSSLHTLAKHVEWANVTFLTDDDLQSLKSSAFEERSMESSTEWSSSRSSMSRSSSAASLMGGCSTEGDCQFRIVDPALEYLFNRKKSHKQHKPEAETTTGSRSSVTSLSSSVSVEFNTYYGRPSWAVTDRRTKDTEGCPLRPTLQHTKASASASTLIPWNGPELGFRINLFALHPDLDERHGIELVQAGFECYPDKDYCIMTLPTYYQGSPLTRHFVRITPRLSKVFPHELYVLHRNSVFSEFSVRPVSLVDHDRISELVESLSQGRRIRRDFVSLALDNEFSGGQAYVLECEECIVGVVIISNDFSLHQLHADFRLEDVIRLSRYGRERHGLLRHAAVSVIFLRAARFFLRRVLQLAGLNTLSYCMHPGNLKQTEVSTNSLLGEMYPVRPRRRVQYDKPTLDLYAAEDSVLRNKCDFSHYIVTEKLLSIPMLELNYRLVIVGASDTAISFLENLIFGSAKHHIRYNNVTLITIHGLPLELSPHAASEKMLPYSGVYDRDYLTRMGLQTYVNILYGIVTVINRAEKMICLNDRHWLRYDYLFLFTGLQFCKPELHGASGMNADSCQKNKGLLETNHKIAQECGDNMFLVNTTADACIALGAFKTLVTNKNTGKIIVYGNCINIYTCTESLLTFGVPATKIVLVESPNTCLLRALDANSVIEKAVLESMMSAGVTVHQGYSLVNWTLSYRTITKVMFRNSYNMPLSVDCLALFCFDAKTTSTKTYLALTDAGIVFNGGIIIDSRFRTNDEFIYAAGPGTTYSSRYLMPEADHKFYSPHEVGKRASALFRQLVEPRAEEEPPPAADRPPRLSEPVTLVARLPGGWHYARVTAPGRPMPLECQLHGQGDNGPVLVTGDLNEPNGPGYFQLTFSAYNTVREITCLSKKEIPHDNLRCLYGLHDSLLNNVLERFNLGMVVDLYAYFSMPWAYALYTSGFPDLVRQCVHIFQQDEDAGFDMIENLQLGLRRLQRESPVCRLSLEELEQIAQMYSDSSVPLYVEHLVLRYVSERPLQLPMYLTDETLTAIHRSYTYSPLHRVRSKAKAVPTQHAATLE